jgi:hypothetical protein
LLPLVVAVMGGGVVIATAVGLVVEAVVRLMMGIAVMWIRIERVGMPMVGILPVLKKTTTG